MNKAIKKFGFVLLLSIPTASYSISEDFANMLAGGTGVVFGTVGGFLCGKSNRMGWLMAIPVGGLSGYLGHLFWHQFTPAGRMKRARTALNKVENNILAANFFDSEARILDKIQEMEISSEWPLIAAFNELDDLVKAAEKSIGLANDAGQEDINFGRAATELVNKAKKMIQNMTRVIKIIRNSKDYNAQLKQYKEEMRHREKMRMEQQKINAQMHAANAQWEQARVESAPKEVHVHHHQGDNSAPAR